LPLSTYAPNFTYQIEQNDALDAMAAGMLYGVSTSKEILTVQSSTVTILSVSFSLAAYEY